MGNYDGIKDAKFFEGGGSYFKDGLYIVKIDAVKEGESRKKDAFFVVECSVIYSSNPLLAPGASVSWLVMLKQDAALSNIKGFAAAATDITPDEVDGKGVELLVSEKNPLRGTVLGVEASTVKTRKGDDFTRVKWCSESRIREKLEAVKNEAVVVGGSLRTPG